MGNLTLIETLLFCLSSENSSDICSENLLSYFLPYMTASTEHNKFFEILVFIKSAFVCWYIKKILRRAKSFTMHYDLLLLVICFHSAVGKEIDVCGLSCVWSCYLVILNIIKFSVWINCLIIYIALFLLLAHAKSYFFLLAFTVHILFVYTILYFIVAGKRDRSIKLIHVLMLVLGFISYYGVLYGSPVRNFDEISLIFMIFVPKLNSTLESRRPFTHAIFIALTLLYCVCKKHKLHSGSK
ncbi:unnamed protein product [Larinioides sclopetarius]|uniref:Uncharacterized protein n=1 Tax=Larinioides sclopetarius TaxID=280406 RepID=A0AAV2A311_9ARAC